MRAIVVILAALLCLAALAALGGALRWRDGGAGARGALVAGAVLLLAGAVALGWAARAPRLPPHDDGRDLAAAYAAGRALPEGPVAVYHLGHSLVGRDMPAMLAQLGGHDHALQLGWGAALRDHYTSPEAVAGFGRENATPRHRDPHEALASGAYGAFVMTEMVRLKDAILYKDSLRHAGLWAAEAVAGNPRAEVFLYESWHALDDGPDWLARMGPDREMLWSQLLFAASRAAGRPVWLIPAGEVMARLAAEAEAQGGIAELGGREGLFARRPDGTLDPIHPGHFGNYLVALTHYAVIYGKSPVGLPRALLRADGTPAAAPSPGLARRMQELVWEVVAADPLTGLRPR